MSLSSLATSLATSCEMEPRRYQRWVRTVVSPGTGLALFDRLARVTAEMELSPVREKGEAFMRSGFEAILKSRNTRPATRP